jgi:hypothetical protein
LAPLAPPSISQWQEPAMTALRRTLNLGRSDDVYKTIVDVHKGLSHEQCRDFDARLILLLVNHIGDEAVIREALKGAAGQ